MKTLLTFTGFHDPYSISSIEGIEQMGPILTIAEEISFDRVCLLSTSRARDITDKTVEALNERCPQSEVLRFDLAIDDPTNYLLIINSIRKVFREIETKGDTDYYISVSSGTPQIHSCWLMLAVSGEIPARLLQTQPPQFVTADNPRIKEIDLTSPNFPVIHANVCTIAPASDISPDPTEVFQSIGIIGDNDKMVSALDKVTLLADRDFPVLIHGETGTGKELFSKAVHQLSARAGQKYIIANCAAIPSNLAESFFFGHKKGSFTGADQDKKGFFEEADKGTLFLDELGELSLEIQAKLLRVLEDGEVTPVGSTKGKKVNVRIIAATNRDLLSEIKEGRFRSDLYQRLNVGRINLPALRERKSDIGKIAVALMNKINRSTRIQKQLSPEALHKLMNYQWPGNVRELSNTLLRSTSLIRGKILDADDIEFDLGVENSQDNLPELKEGFDLQAYEKGFRKRILLEALDLAKGNKSQAARLLGVSPQHLYKMEREL